MMRASNRARRFQTSSEPTSEREALERRWRSRIDSQPRLAALVTAQGCAREPFHRWVPYRQGFSPGLVRLFLSENRWSAGQTPVLDPFSGAGTTITECSRQRVAAVGVEAVAALAFLAGAKFAPQWVPLPLLESVASWPDIACRLESPLHRAALMIAEARRRTGTGDVNAAAPPIAQSLETVCDMMREDLSHPLPVVNESKTGDARSLETLEDASVGAILTSPPYLSRYDYEQTNDAVITLYQFWYGKLPESEKSRQVRGGPTHRGGRTGPCLSHPAVTEAHSVLESAGLKRQAETVRAYFGDLEFFLKSARRVLASDGPAWIVVGGARIKDVYVPSDLIITEMAGAVGFDVEGLQVARELHPTRRKLGLAGHVAPRESVLRLRKR